MAGQRIRAMPDEPQRVTVSCDVVPGPLTEMVAAGLLSIVVDELCRSGVVITAIRVELQGRSTAW